MTFNVEREVITPLHVQSLTSQNESAQLSPGFASDCLRERRRDVSDAATSIEHERALVSEHRRRQRHHVGSARVRHEVKDCFRPRGSRSAERS